MEILVDVFDSIAKFRLQHIGAMKTMMQSKTLL